MGAWFLHLACQGNDPSLCPPSVTPLALNNTLKRQWDFARSETFWSSLSDSVTPKFYEWLKKLRKGSVLNKLDQCCLFSCPHSMLAEWAIKVKCRVVTKKLLLAVNGTGTTNYDTRRTVCKSLATKNKRVRNILYKNATMSKPFSKEKAMCVIPQRLC